MERPQRMRAAWMRSRYLDEAGEEAGEEAERLQAAVSAPRMSA